MPGGIDTLRTTLSTYKRVQDVSSANVARAETDSPRQQVELALSSSNGVVHGLILEGTSSAFDEQLARTMREYQTETATLQRLADTNIQLENRILGRPGQDASFFHSLNSLSNSFKTLTDGQSFAGTLLALQKWTQDMRSAGNTIQDERVRANNDLGLAVTTVNNLLKDISTFNQQIGEYSGEQQTTFINQRRSALHALSAYIGIQIVEGQNNVVDVVTTTQEQLVIGAQAASFVFSSSGVPAASTTYDKIQFQAIGNLGAPTDATKMITASSGQIASLINIRDTYLPGIQEQLDVIAQQTAITFNALHNQGTSLSAPNVLTGEELPGNVVATPDTGVSGTGIVRISSMDKTTGIVTTHVDIDLSLSDNNTIQKIMNTINNATPGLVNANIVNGALVLTSSDDTKGIVVGHAASDASEPTIGFSSGTAHTQGFSSFFGLNNLFVGVNRTPLTGFCQAIAVRSDIQAGKGAGISVAYAKHPATGTWKIGDANTQLASDMSELINNSVITFPETKELSSRSTNIQRYTLAFLDRHIREIQLVKDRTEQSSNILSGLSEKAYSQSGVDIQQEFMLMQQYAQNAEVVIGALSVINRMLDHILEKL